jgi:hypothetical protein
MGAVERVTPALLPQAKNPAINWRGFLLAGVDLVRRLNLSYSIESKNAV